MTSLEALEGGMGLVGDLKEGPISPPTLYPHPLNSKKIRSEGRISLFYLGSPLKSSGSATWRILVRCGGVRRLDSKTLKIF